jgi:RHS repeat-associated protein
MVLSLGFLLLMALQGSALAANDAAPTSQNVPSEVTAGESYTISVTMKNTGTDTWTAAGNYGLAFRNSGGWNVPAIPVGGSYPPGSSRSFTVTITAPSSPGVYSFQPCMAQGGTAFGTCATAVTTTVAARVLDAQYVSQTMTDTLATPTRAITVTMKNTGNTTWLPGEYAMGTQSPQDSGVWTIKRLTLPVRTLPGTTVTFSGTITAPAPGYYDMQWQMVANSRYFGEMTPRLRVGVAGDPPKLEVTSPTPTLELIGNGGYYDIPVKAKATPTGVATISRMEFLYLANPKDPGYSAVTVMGPEINQTVRLPAINRRGVVQAIDSFNKVTTAYMQIIALSDGASPVSDTLPLKMIPGLKYNAAFTVKNTGTTTWNPQTVRFVPQNQAQIDSWGDYSVPLTATVRPGESTVFNISVTAPAKEGTAMFSGVLSESTRTTFGSYAKYVTVARIPPTVTMTSPVTATVLDVRAGTKAQVLVQGSAVADAHATMSTLEVLNGTTVLATVNSNSINQVVELPLGTYSLSLRATDNWSKTAVTPAATVTVKSNDAAYVSQSVPTIMQAGKPYTATVTMRNSGNKPWTLADRYGLGAQNPQDNRIWRTDRVSPPATVVVNGQVALSVQVIAPAKPGTYNFQWRMLQEDVEWFGAFTPNVEVVVKPALPVVSALTTPTATDKIVAVAGKAGVRLQGSATPGEYATISKLEVLDGTAVIATVDGGAIDTVVQLAAGAHTLRMRATDNFAQVVTGTATTAITVQSNFSQIVSSAAPATMVHGVKYPVTVVMRNSGTTTWTAADGYALAPVPDGTTWTVNRIPVTGTVAPNANATFSFEVTAPGQVGAYPFQWQVLQEGKESFGAKSTLQNVTVTGVPPTVSLSAPAAGASFVAINGPAQVPVAGTAGGVDGATISKLELLDGTRVIYTGSGNTLGTTVALARGSRTLQLRATDSLNTTALSQPLTVNVLYNDGSYYAQSIPSTMYAGQRYTVTLTMYNGGTTTWQPVSAETKSGVAAAEYPAGTAIWRSDGRLQLSKAVAPGERHTFTFEVVAPAVPKQYNFQWRMSDEGKEFFGSTSAPVAVSVSAAPPLPVPTFSVSPSNQRVAPGQSGTVTLKGSAIKKGGLVTKLEVFTDSGGGFDATPVKTITGSAEQLALNDTLVLPNGSYRLKLRATDNAGLAAESAPVLVNVTNSPLLGLLKGVRSTAGQQLQLVGWACRDGSAEALNYQVYANAPQALGGVPVASGVANADGEADDAGVRQLCHTPGAAHHFKIDLAGLSTKYPGAPLYVAASGANGDTIVLPCEDSSCRMPDGMRIGLTSPNANNQDHFYLPMPVFARAIVSGLVGTPDEVSFNINGEWLAATSEGGGAYSVGKTGLKASAVPYIAYAKVRQGETSVISDEHLFYIDEAIVPGTVSPADGTIVSVGRPTTLSTLVNATVAAGQSVKFFIDPQAPATPQAAALRQGGAVQRKMGLTTLAAKSGTTVATMAAASAGGVVGSATFDGTRWNYDWTPAQVGSYQVTAKLLDSAGAVLMQTQSVTLTAGATGGPSDAKPVPVTIVPPSMDSEDAGSLPGSVSVGLSGSASYSVALAVPPGTAGMAPNLSLDYDSDGGNGMVGLGWSLGGLSTIHRCAKTIAQDGVAGRIGFDNADRLCLDGVRLVRSEGDPTGVDVNTVDAAYWAVDAEYRTELESFSRIRRQGNGGFKVELKDGEIHYYGHYLGDGNSTILAQGRADGKPLLWALGGREDRSGNYLTVSYSQDGATGEYLPSQIRYGGNFAAKQAADLAVRFEYEPRGDAQVMYIGGSRNDLRQRLTHIKTFLDTAADGAGGTLVRDHTVYYTESASSGRSLVEWMQACTSPVTCLPRTGFEWGAGQAPAFKPVARTPIVLPTFGRYSDMNIRGVFDHSGQTGFIVAKLDVCNISGFACSPKQQSAGATISGQPVVFRGDIRMQLPNGTTVDRKLDVTGRWPSQILVSDVNGDGRDDLVLWDGGDPNAGYCLNVDAADGLPDFQCKPAFSAAVNSSDVTSLITTMVDLRNDRKLHWIGFGKPDEAQDCYFENDAMRCELVPVRGYSSTHINRAADVAVGVSLAKQGRSDFLRIFQATEPAINPAQPSIPGTANDLVTYAALCFNQQDGLHCRNVASARKTVNDNAALSGGRALGDLNGDGLSDFTYVLSGAASANGTYVCLSTEQGADCRLDSALSKYPEMNGSKGTLSGAGKIGDFMGDGVNRLMFTTKPNADDLSSARLVLCRYTLPGFVCHESEYSTAGDEANEPVYVDNGGLPAFLVHSSANGEVQWTPHTLEVGANQDKLVWISDGLKRRDGFEYARGNDAEAYSRASTDVNGNPVKQSYPHVVVAPGVMVKRMHESGGALLRNTTYSYAGALMDATGRGSLGFGMVKAKDDQDIVTSFQLSPFFPSIGMVLRSQQVKNGVVLNDTNISWGVNGKVFADGKGTKVAQPRMVQVSLKDLDGSELGSTETNYQYDSWGNTRSHEELKLFPGEPVYYTNAVITDYYSDADAWLSLPQTKTIIAKTTGKQTVERHVQFDYDYTNGLLKSTTIEPGVPQYEVTTAYDRSGNSFGLVNKETQTWLDPQSQRGMSRTISDIAYDDKGRFAVTRRNELGHAESHRYAPGTGARTSVVDANQLETRWMVDGFGRTTAELKADGNETRFYSKLCLAHCPGNATYFNVVESFNGGERTSVPVTTYRDSVGNVVRKLVWKYVGQQARPSITDNRYSADGDLLEMSWPYYDGDPVYSAKRQDFDSKRRLTRVVTVGEDRVDRETRLTYQGLATVVEDAKQQKRTETRDMLGRMRQVVDAKGGVTSYVYDPNGNLIETTDPNLNVTKIDYDLLGRKTDLHDRDLGDIHYDVDPIGRVWAQTSPNDRLAQPPGQKTRFEYDLLGRMTARHERSLISRWVYDKNAGQSGCADAKSCGRLVEAYTETVDGRKDYARVQSYDEKGRAAVTTQLLSDATYKAALNYDAWGRVVSRIYQRGGDAPKVFDLRYDGNGDFDRIERGYRVLWKATARDASERVTEAVLGNGLTQKVSYDPNSGRQDEGALRTEGQVERLRETYHYDVLGNVKLRGQFWDKGGFTETFEYDALNRLISQTVGATTRNFTFDAGGNIQSKTGTGTGDYIYPPQGADATRPHAVKTIPGIGEFEYDGNGNLTSGAGRVITWASFDMPLTIRKGASLSTFTYGPEHQRVRQDRPGAPSLVYAGNQEVELNGNAATVKTSWPNGIGFEIDRPNAGTSELHWIHRDRLGSVVAISDQDGSVPDQQKFEYDAWGKRRNTTDHDDTPDALDGGIDREGYTGHEMLDGVDLVHMNGRIYDPALARFLSADRYVDATNGQGLNRFSYVSNNPTNFTDPSGYTTIIIGPPPGYSPGGMGGTDALRDLGQLWNFAFQNGTAAVRTAQAKVAIVVKVTKTVAKRSVKKYGARLLAVEGANAIPVFGQAASAIGTLTLGAMVLDDFYDTYQIVANAGTEPEAALAAEPSVTESATGSPPPDDDDDDHYEEESKTRGEKGQTFRGGKKSQRDNWYGQNDKDFQKWWHREGKSDFNGGRDIQNSQNAQDAMKYWKDIGKPVPK